MNLQEFAALKVGDKIVNGMTNSTGSVVELKDNGVVLNWGGNLCCFFYGAASTAWFHWSKADEAAS